ncbi:hypothetical protein BDP27DRAFT_1367043 [Rhodocollybia butyracea]|uniref:Uncharacterized protein n=1 Tax=Rhodocollybia butyracea TaxID=206335 RepID=A0A9P5PK10_9AGAR|nr:hypothetical protein BDP27DRAFT_1367043 [Rhodocollybia butyracea]
MFSFSTIVSTAVMLASVGAYATPVARSTCSPNAQGAPVSIVSADHWRDLKWGDANSPPVNGDVIIGASTALPVHVSQSGQFPTSYIIKDATNNNGLAVSTTYGNRLILDTASDTGTEANQLFDIACQTCGTDTTPGNAAGSSCTISPQGDSNACVRAGDNGSPLTVVECDWHGFDAQLFNIVF